MNKKLLVGLCTVIALLALAGVTFAAKTYSAERFDADWQINRDGSLSVVETVVFNFTGGPFTYVYRELPDTYSGGIEVIAASMDGQPLSAGQAAGQYEVEVDSDTEVTWHFAPTSDAIHTFELRYRVLGAMRREEGADLLFWNFLPTDYDYPIQSATLRVAYPAGAVRTGAPEVTRGKATVSEGDGQVVFRADDIRKDSPLTVALRFEEGSLIAEPPAWQQHAALVAQRAPTMWLLAALVLSVGAVFLASVWRAGARPGSSVREPRANAQSTPPSDLSPALAGALVNSDGKASLVQAMATLFSLAQRGVVTFDETAEKKWYRNPQFSVRLQPAALDAASLESHEEALVAGLFTDKGRDEVKLADLARHLRAPMKLFGKAVGAQLLERRLLDPERMARAARLMVIGVVLLISIVPALIAAVLLWGQYGGWGLLTPLAIFILSMAAFVLGGVYSPRTVAGEEEAAAWRGFRDYQRAVIKGREPSWDLRMFDRYFPYAAAFDQAQGWAKAFQERGGRETPAWFRSLSTVDDGGMAAFIVLTSASHSTTASGGAAGAGGAGGGGGSGAG